MKRKKPENIYDEQAEKLTKKYLKDSNHKFVFVKDTNEDGEPCLVLQIVKKEQ